LVAGCLAFGAVAVLGPAASTPAGAAGGIVLPPANPPANIPASPNFASSCTFGSYDDGATCQQKTLEALANARAAEGLGPLGLPSNWANLTKPQQLLVAINLERVDRGQAPIAGLVGTLNTAANTGAANLADPLMPGGYPWKSYGSIVAGGQSSVLGALYDWLYNDGPGSPNIDCDQAGDPGCWIHRTAILRTYQTAPATMGTGSQIVSYQGTQLPTYAALLVGDTSGAKPTYTFTWAQEVPYLPPRPPAPPAAPTSSVPAADSVRVGWSAPAANGSAITGYVITVLVGGVAQRTVSVGPGATSAIVDGLTGGVAYTFTVAAVNDLGTGAASPPSPVQVPPFASPTAFLQRTYQDLLGRPASAAEIDGGLASLGVGASPAALIAALRTSADATTHVDPTTRLYFAYFLRIPDKGGLLYWIGKHRAGTSLTRISDSFAGSSEFKRRYGTLTNRQFVELIYQNLFARNGDTAGVNYWTGKLDAKAKTRGQVMVGFSESSEYKRKIAAEVDTTIAWIALLGIAPDKPSFDATVTALEANRATRAQMVAALLADPRYTARVTA
jgi:hypothetical protein